MCSQVGDLAIKSLPTRYVVGVHAGYELALGHFDQLIQRRYVIAVFVRALTEPDS
jgi:hypothetical protein